MKTFIEKYTSIDTFKERERFWLKNLIIFKNNKIRKVKFGWTVTGYRKEYIEFSDESDLFYFDKKINDKEYVVIPRFLYVYKEKYSTPIREIVLEEVFRKAYETHKVLKYD